MASSASSRHLAVDMASSASSRHLAVAKRVETEIASGVTELYQRFNCNYCGEDIPGLRIKCGECSDVDLCLDCFKCGAQIGKHKNSHKYIFMNNGGFVIFPRKETNSDRRSKRMSAIMMQADDGSQWNAREEMRLLDAVEMYGYGNWKDIALHIETKAPESTKEQYIKHYIHGLVGKHTWREDLRGFAVDHTQSADRGPLSPTLTGKLPPINVTSQEALLLGYMPNRDDFEDFDKDSEMLVAQIAEKSSEDEDVDVALKLAQCDIYERRLREQVRRKRVARDYQLVSRFYAANPIVQIGRSTGVSPTKITNQIRERKKGDGPKGELMEGFKSFTQFHTAQEFHQFVNNICVEKELKVRVKELIKYRENGIFSEEELIPFEKARFKRHNRLKYKLKRLGDDASACFGGAARLLPVPGDYSLRAILDPDYLTRREAADGFGGAGAHGKSANKKKGKKQN